MLTYDDLPLEIRLLILEKYIENSPSIYLVDRLVYEYLITQNGKTWLTNRISFRRINNGLLFFGKWNCNTYHLGNLITHNISLYKIIEVYNNSEHIFNRIYDVNNNLISVVIFNNNNTIKRIIVYTIDGRVHMYMVCCLSIIKKLF